MFESIQESIKAMFVNLGNEVWGFLSLSFLDPIWGLGLKAGLSVLVLAGLAWFFGTWLPWLRPMIGGLIISIIVAVIFFYKGEAAARAFDKKRRKR